MTDTSRTPDEATRLRESETVFFDRILRVVEGHEVPGMEPWNHENAANMLRRMKANDDVAPDMLAALELAAERLEGHYSVSGLRDDAAALNQISAAIAKARGDSE